MVIENCRNVCNLSSAVEITFCISVVVTPVRVVSCQGCPTEFLCPTPVPPPLLVVPQSDVVHHRRRSVCRERRIHVIVVEVIRSSTSAKRYNTPWRDFPMKRVVPSDQQHFYHLLEAFRQESGWALMKDKN